MKQKVMVCVNFWNGFAEKLDEKQFRQLDYKAVKYWSRVMADLGWHAVMKL